MGNEKRKKSEFIDADYIVTGQSERSLTEPIKYDDVRLNEKHDDVQLLYKGWVVERFRIGEILDIFDINDQWRGED